MCGFGWFRFRLWGLTRGTAGLCSGLGIQVGVGNDGGCKVDIEQGS